MILDPKTRASQIFFRKQLQTVECTYNYETFSKLKNIIYILYMFASIFFKLS